MTHPRSQEAIPRGMEGTREAKELPISRKMSPRWPWRLKCPALSWLRLPISLAIHCYLPTSLPLFPLHDEMTIPGSPSLPLPTD